MEKRRHRRYKRRLTVDLDLGGQFLRAFIIDLSTSGMFVQMNQSLNPGTVVAVRFAPTSTNPMMIVRAVVARRRTVPAHLRAIAASGLGLEILEAPPEYLSIVQPPPEQGEADPKTGVGAAARAAPTSKSVTPPHVAASSGHASKRDPAHSVSRVAPEAAPSAQAANPVAPPVAHASPERRFKVFGAQIEGTRSRTVTIEAQNEAVARERALEKFGEGWEIQRVERID